MTEKNAKKKLLLVMGFTVIIAYGIGMTFVWIVAENKLFATKNKLSTTENKLSISENKLLALAKQKKPSLQEAADALLKKREPSLQDLADQFNKQQQERN